MKRWVLLVFALVVLAPVFVSAQNQPSRTSKRQKAEQPNPPIPVNVNCNCTTQADKGKDKPQGWHKFVTWPEGIGIWVLVATLGAIVWQAVETRRSVGATANSQRSWLLVEGVDKPDLQQVWINKARVRFKIIGNSPLRIMEGKLIYAVVAGRPDEPFTMQRIPDLPVKPIYGEPLNLADSPSMGRIHAPGDPLMVEIPLKSTFLTAQDAKGLEDGEFFLCVYGFVRYRDSFVSWRRRETRFCFACGNWGPTDPKFTSGYTVAGPAAYNNVIEVSWWKRLWYKAIYSYRKTKQQPQETN